ncbi:MAG: hypothetical protein K2W82_06385 [Candidatus Obscuribacterales bacterium]|nr:hypothetical protein [Candidatus Obscuribacterales bacterium]
MKIAKAALPLLAILSVTSNAAVLAGPSSALDPYAYIPAPTKEERELAIAKKLKKVKAPKAAKTVALAPEKTEKAKVEETKVAETKESSGGLLKAPKAVGSTIASSGALFSKGAKSIGHGFASAGGKVKDGSGKIVEGTQVAGGKMLALPKAMGQGMVKTASKVGSSSSGAAKKLAAAPGAIGHGLGKLNPFHKEDSSEGQIASQKTEPKAAEGSLQASDSKQAEDAPQATAATADAVPQ